MSGSMKQFGKILKFELKGYLRNKIFVGVTLFLVVAIAVAMFIPNIIETFKSDDDGASDGSGRPTMLVCSENSELLQFVYGYFDAAFTEYNVQCTIGNVDDVKSQISTGGVACAFVMDSITSYTYYVNNLSMYDVNVEIANGILQEAYRVNLMMQNGLTQDVVADIMSVHIAGNTEVLGEDQAENFFYTYIMIFALYMVILLYGQMVATNVATEKSSRAMEVLITSANPTSMMFGKVLASCIAGLAQLIIVFGSAFAFYNLNEKNLTNPIITSIFDMPLELIAYMLIFFILGFLIYAFLYGAVGSTASKLEDINTSVLPITFLFIIAFFVVITAMTSGNVDTPLVKICSYVPFTSPMAMFTRICMSTVAWYEIALSILVLVASVVGVGVISARIYRVGVLLYGNPPKLIPLVKMVITGDKIKKK